MHHFSKFVFASLCATSSLAFQKARPQSATEENKKFNRVGVIVTQSSYHERATYMFKSTLGKLMPQALKPEARDMKFVHSMVMLQNSVGDSVIFQLKKGTVVCDHLKTDSVDSFLTRSGLKKVELREVGNMRRALTREEVDRMALMVRRTMLKGEYNLLSNNSNTTAEKLVQLLTGGSIGKDVTEPFATFVVEEKQFAIRTLLNTQLARRFIDIHEFADEDDSNIHYQFRHDQAYLERHGVFRRSLWDIGADEEAKAGFMKQQVIAVSHSLIGGHGWKPNYGFSMDLFGATDVMFQALLAEMEDTPFKYTEAAKMLLETVEPSGSTFVDASRAQRLRQVSAV